MDENKAFITINRNILVETDVKIKKISAENHGLAFGKVIDWAVEALYEKLYGTPTAEPISEREEMDRL